MDVHLKVLVGGSAGQKVQIKGPKFFIGRSEDCHLRPRSDLISRHHCALILEEDWLAIRDFGSKNGTVVNGERVVGERELKNGDRLTVGPLQFEVCVDVAVGGKKRPAVTSIKEAAARAAESGVNLGAASDDMDISEWLGDDVVGGTSDTRELEGGDTMELQVDSLQIDTVPEDPARGPKSSASEDDSKKEPEKKEPGKLPARPTAASSNEAATEMLKRLRKFR